MKSRRMKEAEHMAVMGETRNAYRISEGQSMAKDSLREPAKCVEKVILKWTL
jgi:hypothetical protein